MWAVVDRQCAVGGDDHDVLDPGSPLAREVDAGLDGERHALLEGQVVARDDVWLFVHRQSDAVAGAVHESLSQPFGGQHVAGGGVDLLRRDPGPHGVDRRLLGALQHRVAPRDVGVWLADAVGAGGVGVVTGFVRAADVDDDDVTGPQFTVGALVVRVGAVRP